MYLDNIDDRPRCPDDVAAIPSCPFPAKLFPFRTIFSRWTNRDLRQCSAHSSGTSERNSDEVYLIVDSIAIITVRLRFLVMAQRSTRQSTMRREMHEEECGIQYRSRKARFCGLRPGDARAAAKIRHHVTTFLQLFEFLCHHTSDQIRKHSGRHADIVAPCQGVPWFNHAQPSYTNEFGTHRIASSRLSLQLLQ